MIRTSLVALLLTMACERTPPPTQLPTESRNRVSAANMFTRLYAQSRLSGWKVHASAAGNDCTVLLIQTSIVLESAMVEAMHFGAGHYDIYDGGVQRFYRDRTFRGVAYRDSTGRVWTYGAVNEVEAETLSVCR